MLTNSLPLIKKVLNILFYTEIMENRKKVLSNAINTVLLDSMGLPNMPVLRQLGARFFQRAVDRVAELALQLDEKLADGDPALGVR